MPGGRGTLLHIAVSLNEDSHEEIKDSWIIAIDSGYRVQITSGTELGAAFGVCDHAKNLSEIWCHANSKGAVDWDY